MKTIACPDCGKDDRIRKVSSIYSEGRTGTVFTGSSTNVNVAAPVKSGSKSYVGVGKSNTTITGMSQSGLSARLAPPQTPEKKGMGCWWLVLMGGGILGFFAPIQSKRKTQMGIAFVVLLIFLPIFILQEGSISPIIPIIAFGASLAFYILYILGLVEENPRFEHDHQEEMQIWNRKISQWDELYYCYRNDIVFDPDTGRSAPANQLNSLLK